MEQFEEVRLMFQDAGYIDCWWALSSKHFNGWPALRERASRLKAMACSTY
jgi:hypothetical protein